MNLPSNTRFAVFQIAGFALGMAAAVIYTAGGGESIIVGMVCAWLGPQAGMVLSFVTARPPRRTKTR